MRKLHFLVLLFWGLNGAAQAEFDSYGPLGKETYKDLPSALKASEKEKIYKLDLSYQELKPELYDQLHTLIDLQALKLRGNGAIDYPRNFSRLYNLVYFASFSNALSDFPPDLKPFANLYFLEFQQSKIDSVPARIAYLNKLQTFKFGNTRDTLRLPNTLKYLRNLKNVSFENCLLDTLPSALFHLPAVTQLSLLNTNTRALSEELGNLKNLEVLKIENNGLRKVPNAIYKLQKLSVLSLKNNQLTRLPESISQLTRLSLLDLRGNHFSNEEIEKLKALLPSCEIRF